MGTFDDNRRTHAGRADASGTSRSGSTRRPATSGCAARVERFPFVPADPPGSTQDCYEAYNIQVAGLVQRLRAIGDPKVVIGVSGGLDSTHALIVAAQGDGPARAGRAPTSSASRCPASPPATRTKANAIRLMHGARRHVRGARHPRRRPADARRPGPPVRARRAGLRRHVRERAGRAAHRLPVPRWPTSAAASCSAPATCPSWRWAGAPTASATRCRTTTSTPACRRR